MSWQSPGSSPRRPIRTPASRALAQIARVYDAEFCAIWRADITHRRLTLAAHHRLPPDLVRLLTTCAFDAPNLAAQVAATGSIAILDDRTPPSARPALSQLLFERFGIRTEVAIPLAAHGQLVGVLGAAHSTARRFPSWQRDALDDLGRILAGAVETAGLLADATTARAVADLILADLETIAQLALRPTSLGEVLDGLVRRMVSQTGAAAGALLLLNDDGTMLIMRAAVGLAIDVPERYRLKWDEGLAGQVALSGRPIVSLDAQTDPRTHRSFLGALRQQNFHTVVGLPLRLGNELLGVIDLFWQEVLPTVVAGDVEERLRHMVVHDLRAPITSIKGYTTLLARLPQDRHGGPEELKMLANVGHSVQQLERMVRDLLDAARVATRHLVLERHPLDLPTFVREVVQRLAEDLGDHRVEVADSAPVTVSADPQRLEQALANLLVNAGRYSPPGTPIRIDVRPTGSGQAEVAMTNFGVGIPAERQATLFERFTRGGRSPGAAEGLGLGLYIVKGIVEAHGGQIRCESDGKSYVTFRFTLPLAP